jgi:hypothetical protein
MLFEQNLTCDAPPAQAARGPWAGAAAAWVVFSAYCSCTGWVLSALHELNARGYAVALGIGLALAAISWRLYWRADFRSPQSGLGWIGHCCGTTAAWRRRFRRPVPLAFLLLALLVFLSGVLYAPSNWDALSYRVPRVLHWLAAGQWHWIHTQFQRLNVRGNGFEWMMAPMLALFKTDRGFFLFNFIPFLLLPGLFFTSLRRLGVTPRAAYFWMWLLPAGYCYLLHAGSLGNDLFGAFFGIAAIAFGLRARQQHDLQALWVSILAMALTTEVKANNALLGLVWLVIVAPCWRLLLPVPSHAKPANKTPGGRAAARLSAYHSLLTTAAVTVLGLSCSLVPTAVLNSLYAHDWSGTAADGMQNPPGQNLARIAGNCGVVAVDNLTPPVAPFAGVWNARVAPKLVPVSVNTAFGSVTAANPVLKMEELPIEESAGLGLGAFALLLVSAVAARRNGKEKSRTQPEQPTDSSGRHSPRIFAPGARLVWAATVVAVAAFLALSFPTRSEARLLNTYYPFLILPLLLGPNHSRVVRRGWWQGAALLVMTAAALPLMLNPARPLFPAQATLRWLRHHGAPAAIVSRAQRVYAAYGERADALAPLLEFLPPGEKVIGLVTFDDPETSLWKPFGSRRIVHVCRDDTAVQLRARGMRYIWVNVHQIERFEPLTFEEWLTRVQGTVARSVPLTLRAGEAANTWTLVELRD